MKQKAIRIESPRNVNGLNRYAHIRLVGGVLNGYTMFINVAREKYNLELEIDETKLYQLSSGSLTLIDISEGAKL